MEKSDSEGDKSDWEDDSNFNALYDFIDEKFYSTLVSKIKTEVKLALNEALNVNISHSIKQTDNKNVMDFNENKCLKELITTLKEEINLLRNEMDSKDKIIELIIKDKLNERAEKN